MLISGLKGRGGGRGTVVGLAVGLAVGFFVGDFVGFVVGFVDGFVVGFTVGFVFGFDVGFLVGAGDGFDVGGRVSGSNTGPQWLKAGSSNRIIHHIHHNNKDRTRVDDDLPVLGECTTNPEYMRDQCAPACQCCDHHYFETQCPPNHSEWKKLDVWQPGDMDDFFLHLATNDTLVQQYQAFVHRHPVKYRNHTMGRPL
jgi:hypothetical protein